MPAEGNALGLESAPNSVALKGRHKGPTLALNVSPFQGWTASGLHEHQGVALG